MNIRVVVYYQKLLEKKRREIMNAFWMFVGCVVLACLIPPLTPLFLFGAVFILLAYAWQLVIILAVLGFIVWLFKKVTKE